MSGSGEFHGRHTNGPDQGMGRRDLMKLGLAGLGAAVVGAVGGASASQQALRSPSTKSLEVRRPSGDALRSKQLSTMSSKPFPS